MFWRRIKEWMFWHYFKVKNHINYQKVVVVLSDENRELDQIVLSRLNEYMKRKHAKNAIVFCVKDNYDRYTKIFDSNAYVSFRIVTKNTIDMLYSFYCFEKFFDNIVFTHVDSPSDNMLGRVLRETDVNEDDAACLALFHLRCIPDNEEVDNIINV